MSKFTVTKQQEEAIKNSPQIVTPVNKNGKKAKNSSKARTFVLSDEQYMFLEEQAALNEVSIVSYLRMLIRKEMKRQEN